MTDTAPLSKGQRTAQRLLDEAQILFASQGYDATSLRQIATAADIKEPGIYNHFASKEALYEAVLNRALTPLANAMADSVSQAGDIRDYTDLPALMTDLLWAHPEMAGLFQQALQGDAESAGTRLMQRWLHALFEQGVDSLKVLGSLADTDKATLAINVLAMFNLTTGYFLSQRAFNMMADGSLNSAENVARQKALLRKVVRAMLVN
ncbi:MAG: TetR/AcrR family transcriptional regulator [Halieaceae bacterium]|nr:TetR/AcrR family transcriptional regulator [Halieaceae bacterium]